MARRKKIQIPMDGMKRQPTRIGIVRDRRIGIEPIRYRLKIWLKNAMLEERDVLPILHLPNEDKELVQLAKELGLKFVRIDYGFDFLWAFWDGRWSVDIAVPVKGAALLGLTCLLYASPQK